MSKKNYMPFCPKNKDDYISVYWGYYSHLEDEFISIFSAPNPDQYKAVGLYLSIGSEIDVIFKELILIQTPDYEGESKTAHEKELEKMIEDGDMDKYNISISSKDGTVFNPFSDQCAIKWWHSYNMVKHQRTLKDKQGNLYFSHATKQNIQYALAALYILEKQFFDNTYDSLEYDENDPLNIESKIFL